MRSETGPMQFGGDWPGVFVRGDNACYASFVLNHLLDAIEKSDWNSVRYWGGPLMGGQLRDILSCDVRETPADSIQRMKPIEQCLEATDEK